MNWFLYDNGLRHERVKCVNDVYCRGKIKILKLATSGVAFGQQFVVL